MIRSLSVLLACLFAAASAAAQEPSGSRPVFKSGVDLVRFDVRVVDAQGRPVTDLKPEDVEIYDGQTRLPIVLFQRVTEPAESYVDEARRAVTAEVSTNAAFPRGHLYILIFDQQHITPGNEQRARMAAERFIRRRVRPSDRVALFAIPGPGPELGFSADKARASQELSRIRGSYQRAIATPFGNLGIYEAHRIVEGDEKVIAATLARLSVEGGADILGYVPGDSGRGGAARAAGEEPAVVRRLLQENARSVITHTDGESRQFLLRLADVVAAFRDIEGRKSVVLFSEGFFPDNLSRELEAVAAAAAQSYAVFYTFDLNQRTPSIGEAYAPDTTLATEIHSRIAPLATLALETDGTLVVDAANRSDAELSRLAAQAQDYYLVAFTPARDALENRGKYRRVTVKVKRAGARVSARTGYTVAPAAGVSDRRRSINSVLGAPFSQQGLNVDYTTYVLKSPQDGQSRVVLTLTADLPIREKGGDAADVVFVVRDVRDGRVAASGTDSIPLPARAKPGVPLGSGTWRVQFNVPPGSYIMRTVVREPGGLVGSADRRLDVRSLDGPDMAVSDLVVGSALAGLPVRPRAYSGDGLVGVIETYARSAAQLEGIDVRLELRRADNGETVASIKAAVDEPQPDGAGMSRRAQLALPLADVPPGSYIAHAIVRARSEVIGERTRHVEVLQGRAPVAAPEDAAAPAATWRPLDIVQGDLAQKYVALLAERARGTGAAEATRAATANRWEQVELDLRRAGADAGFAGHALRGLALFVREDYEGAAAALKQAFETAPDNALTAFFLGWAYEGSGAAPAALGAWRSAAYLDPSLVSAHLALADGYLRASQPALAIQALRAGLTALPSSPELRARLTQLERPPR